MSSLSRPDRPTRSGLGLVLLAVLSVAAIGGMLAFPPFPQPLYYHDFADQRCFWCIPHTLNVLSNIPFVIVGVWGMWVVASRTSGTFARSTTPKQGTALACASGSGVYRNFADPAERPPYIFFFACIALTGFGSAYYHSNPNNDTLVWDRLPLAMAFMAFFAILIGERIDKRSGRFLFWPLVLLGGGSVIYWHVTELNGAGDLRIYLLVQFFPLLAIPLMLLFFRSRYTRTADLVGALACYVGAKVLEILDRAVYTQGGWVSGHTLKHLLAAVTPLLILLMIKKRRLVAVQGPEESLATSTS